MVEDKDKEISQKNRTTKTNKQWVQSFNFAKWKEFWDCCIKFPINDLTDWTVHFKCLRWEISHSVYLQLKIKIKYSNPKQQKTEEKKWKYQSRNLTFK